MVKYISLKILVFYNNSWCHAFTGWHAVTSIYQSINFRQIFFTDKWKECVVGVFPLFLIQIRLMTLLKYPYLNTMSRNRNTRSETIIVLENWFNKASLVSFGDNTLGKCINPCLRFELWVSKRADGLYNII